MVRFLCAIALITSTAAAQNAESTDSEPNPPQSTTSRAAASEFDSSRGFIAAAMSDFFGGALFTFERKGTQTPKAVIPISGFHPTVRIFGSRMYVVEPANDQIHVLNARQQHLHTIGLPQGSLPIDIYTKDNRTAYISRAGTPWLYRLDLTTGQGVDIADLSPFADADRNPDMSMMISDGKRLYIQVQRLHDNPSAGGAPWDPNGAIAVFDFESQSLIDCNPWLPGIQAIELLGPTPRLKMHIAKNGAWLLVSSTTEFHLDINGGIERVNLQTLTTEGFVISEVDIFALGGFVMINDEKGYLLFHTDILPSNHLLPFRIDGTYGPFPEIIADLGIYLDSLLYDPDTKLLYMASSQGGVHIVDTTDNSVQGFLQIGKSGTPADLALYRAVRISGFQGGSESNPE